MTLTQHLLLYGIVMVVVFLVCVIAHFRFFGNRDLNLNIAVLTIGGLGVGTGISVFLAGLVLALWNCIQHF